MGEHMPDIVIDFDFACRDDCLDRMVPSDLRKLLGEISRLKEALKDTHVALAKETVQRQALENLRTPDEWTHGVRIGEYIVKNTVLSRHNEELKKQVIALKGEVERLCTESKSLRRELLRYTNVPEELDG